MTANEYMTRWLAVGTSVLCMALTPASANDQNRERVVSVSASGDVAAEPDIARFTVGVVTEAKTARAALDENTKRFSAVIAGIKKRGVAAADIATSQFQVNPVYGEQKRSSGNRYDAIEAFRVLNSVTVTVRNMAETGVLIDAATELGANQVGAISFDISGIETKLDYAREQAIQNAMRRAKLYATAAGAELGEIVTIEEHVQGQHPQGFSMARAASASMAAAPIEPGERRISVTIHAVWRLK